MSVNSSASSSDGLISSNLTSTVNITSLDFYVYCLMSKPTSIIYTTLKIIQIFLLLPLIIFISYHGLHQWWQRRFTSSVAAATSHSDCFTYHAVTVELIGVSGFILCLSGIYTEELNMVLGGIFLTHFTWFGEMLFHILMCLELYLAVVHPLIYLSLRNKRGIRIRNAIICCVWLFCFAAMGSVMNGHLLTIMGMSILILALITEGFSSVSVLCALIQPGPGEQNGVREKVDQSKQRAFYTIMAILGVLMLKVVYGLVWAFLYTTRNIVDCAVIVCDIWFNLPSSLVLPLLFLCRAGKLECWKKNKLRG